MIRTPTVLVLGAGASEPYGFPVGSGLRELMLESLESIGPVQEEVRRALGTNTQGIARFMTEFRDSQLESIDTFLAQRRDRVPMGLAVMTAILLEREGRSNLTNPAGEHWYRYLWGRLQPSPGKPFEENRLSVVTFNYDRSLERFLTTAAQNAFGLPGEGAAAELISGTIPIVKVHGSLSPLPSWQSALPALAYGAEVRAEVIRQAMEQVTVLPLVEDSSPAFDEARGLISAAQQVIFLGCHYHPDNMARLGIGPDKHGKMMVGTGFGRTEKEKGLVKSRYGVEVGGSTWKSLEFLRETVDLT